MRLSKLYSNRPAIFHAVRFREGLNVVLGSVRRPKSRDKDTHNLGKTLLAQIIDFCLLKEKTSEFFLFKHEVFSDFVFFLELECNNGRCITVRRSVKDGSKASFKWHEAQGQDYSEAQEAFWDHWMVPFAKSKELLDGILDLHALSPWSFRNAVSYSLRTQKDFDEPFKLSKFSGKHSDWKPLLAHIIGLDGKLVARGYELDEGIEKLENEEKRLLVDNRGAETPDQLRGLIEIAERDLATLNDELERFDLAPSDSRVTQELVEQIDQDIADLNERRYSLLSDKAKLDQALEERFSIDIKSLRLLFEQSKVYFGEQIVKDYAALERFNRELVEERDDYLREELVNIGKELVKVEKELNDHNAKRVVALAAISDNDAISKYKRLSKRLADKQADLEGARRRYLSVETLQGVRRQLRALEQERAAVHEDLEESVGQGTERYGEIRRFLDDVVFHVIGAHANLFTRVNKKGHLEFRIEIVDADGNPTSAAEGFSYNRLMCIAFDMAVQRTYANAAYPHFVYHDGVLETLDDRKKINLVEVIRNYAAAGSQHVITVIESELPHLLDGSQFSFSDEEIILRLHDEGESGRLFKMPQW